MPRQARVERGVAIRFRRAVFQRAGTGGGQEVRFVQEGFGALGEEEGGGSGVGEGWGKVLGGGEGERGGGWWGGSLCEVGGLGGGRHCWRWRRWVAGRMV